MLPRFESDRICVDSTHGMIGYDFELTTLLVVDEYDEGFPESFFCSSSIDAIHLTIFYDYIKKAAGII